MTTVGVGMVGHAFMGRAHSQAWRSVGPFFGPPLTPVMAVLAGRSAERAGAAAAALGWATVETDWKELLRRDDVQLVDICTPGDSHAEIAVAALDAGKHVLCEKPLANSVAEAEAMAAAAERARARGVRSMVGFNYRRVPAVTLARKLVDEGRIGTVRHIRAQYLQDWLSDPEAPFTWRMDRDKAGSGALGDIGAHIIDTAQFITGQSLAGVSALLDTFVPERPVPGGGTARVTVDDAALFIGRTDAGALATFEATRFATGRKNSLRIEVSGSSGALAFDLESLNELWFHDAAEDPRTAGFRRIVVTEPVHPYAGHWWPPGHILGYEHTFTHQLADLLTAIADGADPRPSFADGLQVQRVLAAVADSAASGRWVDVEGSE
ncbi:MULTISPECIES: Gfo/Idh/MocA family protein [Actinomadura]|uniref:Predicted dehydrogenase n=1 Tax=Actinomadura madurae TaxID=1993 RepID=A0A1I5IW00_9ACTN|nr:Gfo/Idh/MocA family oxidoreductase [Actinomadura madurae]MCP9954171.1 Gfo/Idh/MocA family oxidoreductase [Actinomadura madurae]MCP9970922.1 Gfo/Idh/MocA family oxidoreductase [Actinomadura madurae]MCP9983400.1 Gfo/Idh/MocA family oxidoreductase [Actinomadura madurae]MCQ0005038.1 Gfo/Idh/MocA family oxidoreductase [Actinomadura madurae]MCQ0019649.1 Gfo/Idh/MocA family oxidoreductase [Actinomadura madurae]